MTARERAKQFWERTSVGGWDDDMVVDALTAVIEEAVAAEREACARVVDEWGHENLPTSCRLAARAIRARS